jgi:hypothetical protein
VRRGISGMFEPPDVGCYEQGEKVKM